MNTVISERLPLKDYFELTKPKVCALLVFTSCAGIVVTESRPGLGLVFCALLGIWLSAACAASINHLIERHIDRRMRRTANRPLAQDKLKVRSVVLFSLCLGFLSMLVLYYLVNPLTAALALVSLVGYGFVYTVWLKRATSQNIVIGGIFGATPPVLGYAAVTNSIDILAWQMFLLIFLWTPSHFWALAMARREDYLASGLPMLPITHGAHYTAVNVLLYSLLMVLASLLPWLTFQVSIWYLVGALLLGAWYLYFAWKLLRHNDSENALSVFYYSIHYLIWLFAILIIDRQFFIL